MVWRKLTDKLVSTATAATNTLWHGPEMAEKIRQLESMGFSAERSRHALNATNCDVDRAAELLLLGANEDQSTTDLRSGHTATIDRATIDRQSAVARNHATEGPHVAARNEEQIRLAIEESLRLNSQQETQQIRQAEAASLNVDNVIDLTNDGPAKKKPHAKKKVGAAKKQPAAKQTSIPKQQQPIKSAASASNINAGKAAVARFHTGANKLNVTHPDVKLPEKMANKSKEDQIMRCTNRLRPHVMAVDTLVRVLTSVREMPGNPKFRTIDCTNSNYVRYVKDKPGAEDLLLAMNYRRIHSTIPGQQANELRLERHLVDAGLLYLGISALEQARSSEEYTAAKKLRSFHSEMARVAKQNGEQLQSTGMTEAETAIRIEFLSKCPKEPPVGRGAIVQVILGEETERIAGGKVSRRFDGDDTLEDVLNWLGGCYGTELLDKVRGESRVWCLCDLNRYPILPLDVEKHQKKTLQFLGLFPSGMLGVRLSGDAWRDRLAGVKDGGGNNYVRLGSARGLGAASRSMLH